jgi:hypothetical protein
MSSSKKIDLERDFAAGVYLSEAQNPIPPPLHTVYGEGEGKGGGRVEPEISGVGQHRRAQIPKLG